jgi:outer membrane protein TolC
MIGLPCSWRPMAARIVTGLAASALLLAAGAGRCAEPIQPPQATPAQVPLADLAAFRALALERSPVMAAARASLDAAQARSHSLDSIRFGALLARDLPIRRQQAALGIQSYEAALRSAEADTLYSVTWCYLAYLYAREQQDVVLRAQNQSTIKEMRNLVKEIVDKELQPQRRFVDKAHLHLIDAYMQTLEGHRHETLQGLERALAALREATGVGPETDIKPGLKAMPLPAIDVAMTRDEVVALALAGRGEVTQASTFAQVTCLEITAQGRSFMPSLRTFASGSDIHAQPLPVGSFGIDYKPGALAPEMPTMMAGPRRGRMEQASDYRNRAEAVAEKTRNLITLEAENAYYRWKETKVKAEQLQKAVEDAEKYSEFVSKQFSVAAEAKFVPRDPTKFPPDPRVPDVLNAEAVTLRMRVDANRAYWEYLLVLADLERITAGGFRIEFYPAPHRVKPNGNSK